MILPFPAEETIRFLVRTLPPAPARLLEVGCGDGAVARALAARGHAVTALDETLDPEVRVEGGTVAWVEADFLFLDPAANGGPFDALVFSRSLHRMPSLDRAVERAADLLRPRGVLVAEEFAVDRVTAPTARWWYDLEAVLAAAGIISASDPALAAVRNPLGRWRQEHACDPPLATGHAMLSAIRGRFEIGPAEEAPYLYRYVADRAVESAAGTARAVARQVHEIESRLVRERDIAAAGIRITGVLAE